MGFPRAGSNPAADVLFNLREENIGVIVFSKIKMRFKREELTFAIDEREFHRCRGVLRVREVQF